MRLFLVSMLLLAGTVFAAPQWVKSRGNVKFKVEGPFDDVIGETKQIAGTLKFDPAAWNAGTGIFAVDLKSIRTGIDQRDQDMRVEFFETLRFPLAVLTIDKLDQGSASELTAGSSVKGRVAGTFELHGVRRAISFPLELSLSSDGALKASGSFEVPFADYNVQRPQRLFLKLGDSATVTFEVVMNQKQEPVVAQAEQPKLELATTVAQVLPAAQKPKPKPPRKPKPALIFSYQFKSGDAKSRGEKLFHSAEAGGAGNRMTCFHCHAKSDEREGLLLKDGHVRAASTIFDSGQRPQFFNGFATDPGKAANICQKQFMLGSGLTKEQEEDLIAFVDAVSPDSAPEIDYRTNYRSMEASLRDPMGGDIAKGKKLADRYCMTCHLDGRVGPVWAPGLYDPEWIVRRVRRLEGHHNRQMPNFTIQRLPDTDLRDIVTYLTSPASAPPIFNRKKNAEGIGGR